MGENLLIPIGGSSFVLFPWLGTRAFRTIRRYLSVNAGRFGISDVSSEGCCFITFKAKDGIGDTLEESLIRKLQSEGIDPLSLVGEGECPVFEKYDDCLPPDLLRRAFACDRLSPGEVIRRFSEKGGRFDG